VLAIRVVPDPAFEAEGLGEKISGKMQTKIGDLERVIEKS
jgi:uncharacterized protein YjbJ (UPF0337 family)